MVEQAPDGPAINLLGDTLWCSITASSYQWYFNNNAISGATNQYFLPDSTGNYTVEALGQAGCPSPGSTVFMYTAPPIGVEELRQVAVQVWPNPVRDRLMVQVPDVLNGSGFALYDAQGRLAASGMLSAGRQQLDVAGLQRGVYLLHIPGTGVVPARVLVLE